MKTQEIVFKCFYCHEEVPYKQRCEACDTPLLWTDVYMDYSDKFLEIYKVWVK